MRYVYLGDKWTAPALRGQPCDPVRRADGKCILSVRMATALVRFADGALHVVKRRRLRVTRLLLILLALALSAPAGAAPTIDFTTPAYHALPGGAGVDSLNPLSDGYRRHLIGVSWQSPYCRDSLSQCRDVANMAKWIPGAQIVVLDSLWARPGLHFTLTVPPVASLTRPYSVWIQAWTDVPNRWQLVGTFP